MIDLKIIILIVASVFSAYFGYSYSNTSWQKKYAEMERQKIELESKAKEVTVEEVIKYVDRVKEVKTRGETIYEKIPVYITAETDAACTIPVGFARLLNAAATSTAISETAGNVDEKATTTDSPSGDKR